MFSQDFKEFKSSHSNKFWEKVKISQSCQKKGSLLIRLCKVAVSKSTGQTLINSSGWKILQQYYGSFKKDM